MRGWRMWRCGVTEVLGQTSSDFATSFSKISFAHPWALLLLALPVLLVVWEMSRQGVLVRLPFDPRPGPAVRARGGGALGGLVMAADLVPGVILAWAVVLMAGPRRAVEG